MLTDVLDKNHAPVIAAIKPNGSGFINCVKIDTNIVLSTYGKGNISNYVGNAFKENRILYVDKTKSQQLQKIPGVQFPNKILTANFNKNLSPFRTEVNRKIGGNKKTIANTTGGTNSHSQKITEEDSLGCILTKEQLDFFKNSKIRDENGNLKVMYHGTQTGGFTVFVERCTIFGGSFK